eukprot:CAMPEP_0175812290 /NCGR_PEP_ID=MMETSP0107_2-20121207/4295_1 /TAXON_ID=195067 ORGANISM="Goniomonas pacifica, Strain CCMP1869" /NCGR_SAMPLE_ID=MMETSP0107_2 /ASSEMBLY_ACC=CAM_ASM_000203 /LENGTH=192 /DNA_ID=CAMNT_0017124137 /DNA_START=1578 /DNA_END=2158 /DNA_ORIENTATION=-
MVQVTPRAGVAEATRVVSIAGVELLSRAASQDGAALLQPRHGAFFFKVSDALRACSTSSVATGDVNGDGLTLKGDLDNRDQTALQPFQSTMYPNADMASRMPVAQLHQGSHPAAEAVCARMRQLQAQVPIFQDEVVTVAAAESQGAGKIHGEWRDGSVGLLRVFKHQEGAPHTRSEERQPTTTGVPARARQC